VSLAHVQASAQLALQNPPPQLTEPASATSVPASDDFSPSLDAREQIVRRTRSVQLVLHLEGQPNMPLYRALAEAIRNSILQGRLSPGQPLPSTRELSDSLNVSRSTALRCYEELVSQGYIETSIGSGTYVSRRLPAALEASRNENQSVQEIDLDRFPPVEWSRFANRLEKVEALIGRDGCQVPELKLGIPTHSLMPLQHWEKMLLRHSHLDVREKMNYDSDAFGHKPLRDALVGFLSRARSVRCDQSRVAIFSGTQNALDLICRLLIDPGDLVAVENPGYPAARRAFLTHGAELVGIGVDENGVIVDELQGREDKIKLLYVTPSHQDPTGAVLSHDRRKQLLAWAQRHQVIVIEDDNDCEYRYVARTLPSLQGMDENDCVIYMSSLWKTMGTATRLGYMVLPQRMVNMFMTGKAITDRDFPMVEQWALTDFINEGFLERHIHRSRAVYARRRQALIHSLTLHLGKLIRIAKESSAMHNLVRFPVQLREDFIVQAAADAGVDVVSTRRYYLANPARGEFLLGFAHQDEEEIRVAVAKFATAIKTELASRAEV
jgi:GntR family transcriptional regulator/MocR family aminotransferase